MVKEVHSKRVFIKKMAALAGFIAAADYTSTLIVRSDSIEEVNDDSANDANLQAKTLLRKQFVLMTDNEKNQMLDEILNSHNKDQA